MSAFATSSRKPGKVAAVSAAFVAVALALSGCAASGTDAAAGDGVLKLGTILPQTGALAFLGPPEEAGVQLAINDINAAGGVLGKPVEIEYRDSGDTTTDIAQQSVTELLSLGVDAIIGAASSGVSKTVIDQITKAKVVQFSPANTSPDFTTWDDGGYYWRAAPSDLLQGNILGNEIVNDGNANVGIIYLNDAYGTGLEKQTREVIEAAGGTVVATEAFNEGDTNFDAQIDKVVAASPDAIVLITFDQSKVIIPALQTKGFPGDKLYFVDGNLADYSESFEAGYITGAKGTLPGGEVSQEFKDRLLEVDPGLTDFAYAAESYDAVILIALAAIAAGSDSGEAISKNLLEVSRGGEKVTDFATAAEKLAAGADIDYDGVSGPIEFDENGDPTGAFIGIYQYGADNKYTLLRTVAGSAG